MVDEGSAQVYKNKMHLLSVLTIGGVQNGIASVLRCLPGCVVTGTSQVNLNFFASNGILMIFSVCRLLF